MSGIKDIMNLAGVKSCITVDKGNLPMKVLFMNKEYVLKSTANNGLIMVKNAIVEEKQDDCEK